MSYFSTPSTYSHNRGPILFNPNDKNIYPTDLQNYKSVQAIKGDYLNPHKPELSVSTSKDYRGVTTYQQANPGASWGAARNVKNVNLFNPSVTYSNQAFYDSGQGTKRTDSGRPIYVDSSSDRAVDNYATKKLHDKSLGKYSFGVGPAMFTENTMLRDYTETNSEASKKEVNEYLKSNNVLQSHEYTTPGKKSIKLASGRVIEFEVDTPEVEIGRCPRPESKMPNISSNLHAAGEVTDEYLRSKAVNPWASPFMSKESFYNDSSLPSSFYNDSSSQSSFYNDSSQQSGTWSSASKNNLNNSYQSIYEEKYLKSKPAEFDTGLCLKENFSFGKSSKIDSSKDMGDVLYGQLFKTYSKSILDWLLSFKPYEKWMDNWKILEKNLEKTDLNITNLPIDDEEIAYTLNKGEVIKFRWRDNKSFISKNVFIYVLLHELTHEVFPPSFQGHGDPFPQMLCLLCVAATELDLIQIDKLPDNIYMSNGRPITSRSSIIDEIIFGIDMLIDANKNNPQIVEYYNFKKVIINKKR